MARATSSSRSTRAQLVLRRARSQAASRPRSHGARRHRTWFWGWQLLPQSWSASPSAWSHGGAEANALSDDLAALTDEELENRVAAIRERMRPVEQQLVSLRGERDLLLTERRRRDRIAHRESRADLKAAMREGRFPTIAELVAGSQGGALDEYAFNLKTGGEVRLGYPGARLQSLTLHHRGPG